MGYCRIHNKMVGVADCLSCVHCLPPSERKDGLMCKPKIEEWANLKGKRFRATFDSSIDYFEICGYDDDRDMVLTIVHPKEGEPFDDEIERNYLLAGFSNGDYKAIIYKPVIDDRTFEILTNEYLRYLAPPPIHKQMFCGPCCDRCQHRFGTTSNRNWCMNHYKSEKCYRFKLKD